MDALQKLQQLLTLACTTLSLLSHYPSQKNHNHLLDEEGLDVLLQGAEALEKGVEFEQQGEEEETGEFSLCQIGVEGSLDPVEQGNVQRLELHRGV